jgi:opacity protein-like surface antigen
MMKLNLATSLILTGVLGGAVFADSQPAPSESLPASSPTSAPASAAAGEFYVDPGIALTGAGASNYKNSFSLDAGYLKVIHQIASIGWEAGYLFGSKFENDNFTSDTQVKIVHIAPEIKLGPTIAVGDYKINPFVMGGGGLYWSHQNSGTVTTASGATASVDSFDHINGGWNFGLGTAFSLPGNWSVGLDVRRHEIVNKHSSDFTWVTPALRFALQFS